MHSSIKRESQVSSSLRPPPGKHSTFPSGRVPFFFSINQDKLPHSTAVKLRQSLFIASDIFIKLYSKHRVCNYDCGKNADWSSGSRASVAMLFPSCRRNWPITAHSWVVITIVVIRKDEKTFSIEQYERSNLESERRRRSWAKAKRWATVYNTFLWEEKSAFDCPPTLRPPKDEGT